MSAYRPHPCPNEREQRAYPSQKALSCAWAAFWASIGGGVVSG